MTSAIPRPSVVLSAVAVAAVALVGCATTPTSMDGMRVSQGPRSSAPDDVGASGYGLYLAGEAAIDAGSSKDAAIYFGRASQLEPGSATVQARAFSSALVSGQIERAAEAAGGLGEGDAPIQNLGRLTRAVEAMAEERGKQAVLILSAGPPIGAPHADAAVLLKPWALAEAGDIAAATAPGAMTTDPVTTGVAALGRAEILERTGRLTDAEAAYKLRAVGRDGLFQLAYGGFLERGGRKDDAIGVYTRGLAANPGDVTLRAARARVQAGAPPRPLPTIREGAAEALIAPAALMLARHEGDSGLAYLRLALRLDPTLDEAWVLVGDAMTAAGDQEAARDAYLKVQRSSDQYLPARGRLALQLQSAGDKDGALRVARETLDAEPKEVRALVLYADLLREDERYTEAVPVLDRAIVAAGDDTSLWSLYYLRGASRQRSGDWAGGEADLQTALRLKPDEAEVLNYLGYAWADRGEHLKEALGMLEKASNLEPKSGAILDSLGWAHYRIGQYRDAARELERAVLLDPADPEVNNHLGDAYWRTGRKLEARYQWNRVLTLDADAKTRAAVEAKLADGLPEAPPAAVPMAAANTQPPKTP